MSVKYACLHLLCGRAVGPYMMQVTSFGSHSAFVTRDARHRDLGSHPVVPSQIVFFHMVSRMGEFLETCMSVA